MGLTPTRAVRAAAAVVGVLLVSLVAVLPASAAPAAPDLRARIDLGGATGIVGQQFQLEVTSENFGTANATNVVATIDLPAGITVTSIRQDGVADPPGCSTSGTRTTCHVATIRPGDGSVFNPGEYTNIVLELLSSAPVPHGTATFSISEAETEAVPDAHPNTATAAVVVQANQADYGVRSATTSDTLVQGQDGTLAIDVGNLGPAQADAVRVVITVAAGLTIDDVGSADIPGCSVSGQVITCVDPNPLFPFSDDDSFFAVHVHATVVQSDLVSTVAVSSSTSEPSPQTLPDTVQIHSRSIAPVTDLALASITGRGPLHRESPGPIDVQVDNETPTDAAASTIDVHLPSGVVVTQAQVGPFGLGTSFPCAVRPGLVHCPPNTIEGRRRVVVSMTVVPGTEAPFTVSATVTTTTPEPVPDPHADTASATFVVGPRERHITGTVTGPDGQGDPGASVVLVTPSLDRTIVATTTAGAGGAFGFYGTPAGTYRVLFGGDPQHDYAPTSWHGGMLVVPASGDVTGVDQQVGDLASVKGTITFHGQPYRPTSRPTIRLFQVGNPYPLVNGAVSPGSTPGSYQKLVPPDDYQIELVPGGALAPIWYGGSASRGGATVVHVGSGQLVLHLDVALRTAGRVTGAAFGPLGRPQGGVTVQVFARPADPIPVASATTLADGSYAIAGLLPGGYQVRFVPSATYGPQWYRGVTSRAAATTVTVPEGGDVANVSAILGLAR